MSVVVPAILPQSSQDLEDKLAQLADIPAVTAVQIDAVDGRFVAPPCWPYTIHGALESMAKSHRMLPKIDRFVFDADLMTEHPERAVDLWSALGATRLTLHAESTPSLLRDILNIREKHGHARDFAPGLFSLGLAVSIATDLSLIQQCLGSIDYIQLMGIAVLGKQGEPFDRRVIERIRAVRRMDPRIIIQIDGAVTLHTAPALLAAGASRLVVGHDIWRARSIAYEIAKFDALVNPYNANT